MAGLFACTKCHSRQPFEELSKEEHLCKVCRKKYPIAPCFYCKLEYHILKKVDGNAVCAKCQHSLSQYGQPKHCKYCQAKAAFKSSCCARCVSSEKKYGPPIQCGKCKMNCAFTKGEEAKSKVNNMWCSTGKRSEDVVDVKIQVGGKVLCLQCTIQFKRHQYKAKKEQRKDKPQSKYGSGPNPAQDPVVAPLRAENLAVSYKSRFDTVERASKQTSHSDSPKRSSDNFDPTFGDHMSEITKLRDQIAFLKKTIVQKDKIILEKDKKISEFHAEKWEKEKSIKQRIQAIQKESNEKVENLQVENSTLKRQVASLQKTRKTPKTDRNISRIRLEPHKFGSPHSNRDAVGSCESANESDSGLALTKKIEESKLEESKLADKEENKNKESNVEIEEKNENLIEAQTEEQQQQLDTSNEEKPAYDSDDNTELEKHEENEPENVESQESKITEEENMFESRDNSSDEDKPVSKPDDDDNVDDDNDDNDDDEPVDQKSVSFDEAQEAGIKMIMKVDADDEYSSSSAPEDADQEVEQQTKRKSKAIIEDDNDDSDDNKQTVSRKAQVTKRKLSSDNESDQEANNNVKQTTSKKSKKEASKKMKKQAPAAKKKGKTVRKRTVSVSSVSSDSSSDSSDEE